MYLPDEIHDDVFQVKQGIIQFLNQVLPKLYRVFTRLILADKGKIEFLRRCKCLNKIKLFIMPWAPYYYQITLQDLGYPMIM